MLKLLKKKKDAGGSKTLGHFRVKESMAACLKIKW